MSKVFLRPAEHSDADSIANVIYEAFNQIAAEHGQLSDFDSPAIERTRRRLKLRDQFVDYCVIAETGNQIVGVNFNDRHSDVGAIGVLAVSPSFQGQGIGRRLMESVIEHGTSVGYKSQRLLQAAYNSKSMGLYLRLGMVVREHFVNLNGTIIRDSIGCPNIEIERALEEDVQTCSMFCEELYRAERSREINDAAVDGSLLVARECGNIVGLTTGIGFSGFSVALTNDVLKELIVNHKTIESPGILVPATNHSLLSWCLESGLKINQSLNLMTLGEYEEPVAKWIHSINF